MHNIRLYGYRGVIRSPFMPVLQLWLRNVVAYNRYHWGIRESRPIGKPTARRSGKSASSAPYTPSCCTSRGRIYILHLYACVCVAVLFSESFRTISNGFAVAVYSAIAWNRCSKPWPGYGSRSPDERRSGSPPARTLFHADGDGDNVIIIIYTIIYFVYNIMIYFITDSRGR
jgi:hypothetical protein